MHACADLVPIHPLLLCGAVGAVGRHHVPTALHAIKGDAFILSTVQAEVVCVGQFYVSSAAKIMYILGTSSEEARPSQERGFCIK
jgi:hypothetical protein